MLQLYDNVASGNAYKVRLMLAHLDLSYERIPVSVTDRSNRQDLFAGKNPALRIPVLRLEDGRFLGESNAIVWYLAEGTPYLPDDRYERGQVLQWMFFEQYDHDPTLRWRGSSCITAASRRNTLSSSRRNRGLATRRYAPWISAWPSPSSSPPPITPSDGRR